MSKQAVKFAEEILQAAVKAHIMHWMSRKYSEHIALGEFYEALPGLIDAVVEEFQGKYGLLPFAKQDPIQALTELNSFVASYRDFCEDSEIQNDIDAIASQIDSTLYKLKFLG